MTKVSLVFAAMAVAAMASAAPATARQEPRTELVELGGAQVESLLLRYHFDATWAVSDTGILMRDTQRDYYLISLKAPCEKLGMQRGFTFVPALAGRVKAALSYEVRDVAGRPCDVARLEQISDARAAELRASLASSS